MSFYHKKSANSSQRTIHLHKAFYCQNLPISSCSTSAISLFSLAVELFLDYQNYDTPHANFSQAGNELTNIEPNIETRMKPNFNNQQSFKKQYLFLCSVNQVIVPSWQLLRTLVTMVLDAEIVHPSRPTHRNRQLHRLGLDIADDDLSWWSLL